MVELRIKIPLPEDPAKRALVIAIVGSILLHVVLLAWLITMNPRGTPAYVKRGEPLLVDMAPDKPEEKAPLGNPSEACRSACRAASEEHPSRRRRRRGWLRRPPPPKAPPAPKAPAPPKAPPAQRAAPPPRPAPEAPEAGGQGRAAPAGAKGAARAAGTLSGCACRSHPSRRPSSRPMFRPPVTPPVQARSATGPRCAACRAARARWGASGRADANRPGQAAQSTRAQHLSAAWRRRRRASRRPWGCRGRADPARHPGAQVSGLTSRKSGRRSRPSGFTRARRVTGASRASSCSSSTSPRTAGSHSSSCGIPRAPEYSTTTP
jgi:hypothetical protein